MLPCSEVELYLNCMNDRRRNDGNRIKTINVCVGSLPGVVEVVFDVNSTKTFFSLKQSDSIVMRIICSLFICIRRKQIRYRFENKEIFIFRWRISSSDGYKTQISLFHNILRFLTFRSTKIILMLCYSQTSRRFCTVSSEDSFQTLVKWMSLNEQQDVTRKHP